MSLGHPAAARATRRAAFFRSIPRLLLAAAALIGAAAVAAQGRGGFGGGFGEAGNLRQEIKQNPAGFILCRLMYTATGTDQSGSGWSIETPRAEQNFMTRLSQFTTTKINRWSDGEPGFAVLRADNPDLYKCPFVMLASPGSVGFSEPEVTMLRDYLLKGGFVWADDFWGEASWQHWSREIKRVLPEYEIVDLTPAHPLFSTFYQVTRLPQVPSKRRWNRPGDPTSEFGAATAEVHFRAIFDEKGRLLVFMTHNTDIADSFEREGDSVEYMETFSPAGYAVGMNLAVWVMSH
jgi:hypothetical protein